MVKERVWERCGLGLMILADVVGKAVVGINIATTINNNVNIIVLVIDDTWW